jgi:hypothetical protein
MRRKPPHYALAFFDQQMFPIHLVLPPVELSLLDGSPAQWCISIWEQFAYLFNPIYDTSVMYSLNPLNCSKSHAIYIHGETFSFHFFIVALVGLIAVYELPTTIDTDYDSVYLLYAHFYSHELTYIQGISLTLTHCSLFFLILLSIAISYINSATPNLPESTTLGLLVRVASLKENRS